MTIIFRQNISIGYKDCSKNKNGESEAHWTGENLAVDLYMTKEAYESHKDQILKVTAKLNQSFIESKNIKESIVSVYNEYSRPKIVVHGHNSIAVIELTT